MADDNRYGGSNWNRDYDRSDRNYGSSGYGSSGYGSSSYGSSSYGGGSGDRDRDSDRDRSRGYGAYSQGGSFGQQGGWRNDRSTEFGRRDNDRFDNYDENRRIAIDETDRLIASDKVEGTRVYNRRGDRLGTIHNFMVEKRAGRVEYAVMSFGGFLGMGERYYPLPWSMLTYDERQGGYVVDIDERQLDRAPSYSRNDQPRWDRGYSSHINDYYGVRY